MNTEQKLIALIVKILEMRSQAVDWHPSPNMSATERLIATNNNAGREEALSELLCWIEDNDITHANEPIHSNN